MKFKNLSLKIILGIALVGMIFSGYLSWGEFSGAGGLVCPTNSFPQSFFGFPSCVYGFSMYVFIGIIALFGIVKKAE